MRLSELSVSASGCASLCLHTAISNFSYFCLSFCTAAGFVIKKKSSKSTTTPETSSSTIICSFSKHTHTHYTPCHFPFTLFIGKQMSSQRESGKKGMAGQGQNSLIVSSHLMRLMKKVLIVDSWCGTHTLCQTSHLPVFSFSMRRCSHKFPFLTILPVTRKVLFVAAKIFVLVRENWNKMCLFIILLVTWNEKP